MAKRTSSKNKTHVSMTSGRIDTLLCQVLSEEDRKIVEKMKSGFLLCGVLNGRQQSHLTKIESRYAK